MPHGISWPICPECGIRHDPQHPHAATTIEYQKGFFRVNGRQPTYADAASHCSQEVRDLYRYLWNQFGRSEDDVADLDWIPEQRWP